MPSRNSTMPVDTVCPASSSKDSPTTCCLVDTIIRTPILSLVGREREAQRILSFVCRNIIEHRSGFLRVAGRPGTGKSATLNLMCRQLIQARENSGRKAKYPYVLTFCNCTNYTSSKAPYFWRDLASRVIETERNTSGRTPSHRPCSSDDDSDDDSVGDSDDGILTASLTASSRKDKQEVSNRRCLLDPKTVFEKLLVQPEGCAYKSIIIVLDEIDLLEKQAWGGEALKCISAWIDRPNSQLILIGCGNTLTNVNGPSSVIFPLEVCNGRRKNVLRRSMSSPREQFSKKLPNETVNDLALPLNLCNVIDGESAKKRSVMDAVWFEPYTADQIAVILQNEIENNSAAVTIDAAAKQLLAKRIANDSGDLRQAKDALRLTLISLQADDITAQTRRLCTASPVRRRPSPHSSLTTVSPRKVIRHSPLTTPVKARKAIGVFDVVKTLNHYAPQSKTMLNQSKENLSLKQKIILSCFISQPGGGRSMQSDRYSLTFAELCDVYKKTCDRVKLVGVAESEIELYNMVEMLEGLGLLKVETKTSKGTPLKRFNSSGSLGMGSHSIRQHLIAVTISHRDLEMLVGQEQRLLSNTL